MSQFPFLFSILLLSAYAAVARDLRPSDHGLIYQEDAFPPGDARDMRSFFGAAATVQLPEAKNISEAVWSTAGSTEEIGSRDTGRDHVRVGLLVASAACGFTGIVLLGVSGVVLLIRIHKRRAEAERVPPSTSALAEIKSIG